MNKSEIVLYTTSDGKVKIETIFQNETLWLTQAKLAELFNVDRSVITKHLELKKKATCAKFAHVQIEGDREVSRKIEFYNLDAIIAEGYRVNSKRATPI
ncbi:MAG: RhuM family protein [Candidatus Anammoxibacter sp.]